jgi:phosphoglycerate kinase
MYVGDSLRALSLESASSTILPRLMEKRVAGLALAQELDSIARVRSQADRPRLLIWGGSNLSARLPLLRQLLVDGTRVFLVGVAAHTMLAARGGRLGRSKVEDAYLAGARTLDAQLGERLLVPSDHLIGTSAQDPSPRSAPADAVADDCLALDLGPQTLAALQTEIARAGLVLWCGAPGLYREEAFAGGTRALVEMLGAALAFTVAAGDDTVAAARFVAPEALRRLDYLADGGDAALTLLNENRLPGLEAIRGPAP